MSNGPAQNSEHWTIDKRVQPTLIIALVAQAVGFGWWAATMEGNLAEHARRITNVEIHDAAQTDAIAKAGELLARIDERTTTQTLLLSKIEARLNGGPLQSFPPR
jgi:hypothetical protein